MFSLASISGSRVLPCDGAGAAWPSIPRMICISCLNDYLMYFSIYGDVQGEAWYVRTRITTKRK